MPADFVVPARLGSLRTMLIQYLRQLGPAVYWRVLGVRGLIGTSLLAESGGRLEQCETFNVGCEKNFS